MLSYTSALLKCACMNWLYTFENSPYKHADVFLLIINKYIPIFTVLYYRMTLFSINLNVWKFLNQGSVS